MRFRVDESSYKDTLEGDDTEGLLAGQEKETLLSGKTAQREDCLWSIALGLRFGRWSCTYLPDHLEGEGESLQECCKRGRIARSTIANTHHLINTVTSTKIPDHQ